MRKRWATWPVVRHDTCSIDGHRFGKWQGVIINWRKCRRCGWKEWADD